MNKNSRKILNIKSDPAELKTVELFVYELFKQNNINNKCFNKAYLCTSEAVINSIEHGNKYNKNKQVKIVCFYENDVLNVIVTDEGKGFNPDKIDDPTKSENRSKENGRGVFIIRKMADYIQYNAKGNSVHIKIKCSE